MNGHDERLCECGECKYCKAFLSSDYDTDKDVCWSCKGNGGCIICEEKDYE